MGTHHQIRMPAKILPNMVGWFQNDFLDVIGQMRLSFLPPLRVYFAVMAAFTNLALSAGHLGTRYLNAIIVVERGRNDELGALMISAAVLGFMLPIITLLLFNWKFFSANILTVGLKTRLPEFFRVIFRVLLCC